ncbi:MAG: hypothetical protein H3Z53_11420 [archaeon]|nr:hypothetical protein [archaeon]MCP8314961.1 hypothetical protein [archaeon]
MEANKWFRKNAPTDDRAYDTSLRFTNWHDLHSSSLEQAKKAIFFLNQWRCRIPRTNELAQKIKETHKVLLPFLKAVEFETLQDINLEKIKKVNDEWLRIKRIIHLTFDELMNMGYRFSYVATSKFLHMVNSRLFMMWDNRICENYHVKPSAYAYAHDFIPLMKSKANQAIESYIREHKCARDAAVREITQNTGRCLPKLLDEFNLRKTQFRGR